MINTRRLLLKLSKKYPKRLCEAYDFSGLQIGKLPLNCSNILLCLDFDDIVLNKLNEQDNIDKIDLIITHHPFIFGKKSVVLKNDPIKLDLYNKLQDINLPIYSFHTNFDSGIDGMNDALAKELDLINIKPLDTLPMARGGYLKEPMQIEEFARYCNKKLNVKYSTLLHYGKNEIKSVAIIGGGGAFGYKNAKEEGYDIYISGDISHHIRRDIILSNYNYLDMPHEIEKIFMKQMKKVLLEIDPTLNILCIDHEIEPEVII